MATGGMYGAIEPFSGKSWASWIQRVNFYLVANDISNEEKKRAFLLTLCGADTFETACALVAPKTPGEVSFSELVTLLQRHFDPRPSELYGRYVFQRRDQNPGESISSYVATLRSQRLRLQHRHNQGEAKSPFQNGAQQCSHKT